MRRPRVAVLAAVVLALVPGAGGDGLRQVLDNAVRQGSPGALAQSRDDGVVRNLSSGVADVVAHRPPSADMRFRIASITKTFVATAILRLVAEGRLRLDTPLAEVLPGVVRNADAITMRMLLAHTSGLYDYTEDPEVERLAEKAPAHCFTPRELADAAGRHPPSFRPGASWKYSNTNYSLLVLVMEKITGRPYAQVITESVLRPLGLKDTYFPGCSPWMRGPHLHGYVKSGPARPGLKDVTVFNPTTSAGDGDMISTLGDLNRFVSALLAGRLLPRGLLDTMLTPTPGSFPQSDTFRYGLGTVIATTPCGVTVYGGAGTMDGSLTWVAGTRGGRHTMALALNGSWVDQTAVTTRAITAEFCPR